MKLSDPVGIEASAHDWLLLLGWMAAQSRGGAFPKPIALIADEIDRATGRGD